MDASLLKDKDGKAFALDILQVHIRAAGVGKTPMQTFLDAKPIAEEQMLAA